MHSKSENKNNIESSMLSSLCNIPAVLSLLSKQSNSLAQLTDESCITSEKLKAVLLVCNTALLTDAFTLILKKIHPQVLIQRMDFQSIPTLIYDESTHFDVCVLVLQEPKDIENNISSGYSFTKTFIIAPRSLKLPPLEKIGANAAIALESDVNTIQSALVRGLGDESFSIGFTHDNSATENKYSRLTPRQKDVLDAICIGKSNKEIARELNISLNTIKVHCAAIFRELGVTNRTQAALLVGK